MQDTSSLYNEIITNEPHWFETKVEINEVEYNEEDLMSVSTSYQVFSDNQPEVGNCISAELEVKMQSPPDPVPRMAKVRPYVRVKNDTQESEWIPQGVFYIDTRETTHNDDGNDILTLHCYDAMLKAEADYPSTTSSFPKSDTEVVKEIAKTMGLQSTVSETTGIDSRTIALMDKNYQIAAMYAGNWVMNYEGKLRLITLAELPPETYYLIDSLFEPITFGGDHILV